MPCQGEIFTQLRIVIRQLWLNEICSDLVKMGMAIRMVVGVNMVLDPPGNRLSEGLLPAFGFVPPGSREKVAVVLIPKIGKHGNFKAEVGMLLRKLADRPDRGTLGYFPLVIKGKLVGEVGVVDGQDQGSATLRNSDIPG